MVVEACVDREILFQMALVLVDLRLQVQQVLLRLIRRFEECADVCPAGSDAITLQCRRMDLGLNLLDCLLSGAQTVLNCLLHGDHVVYLSLDPVKYIHVRILELACELLHRVGCLVAGSATEVERVDDIELLVVDDLLLRQTVWLHLLKFLREPLTMALIPRQRLDHLLLEFYLVVLDLDHAERLLLKQRVVVRQYLQEVHGLLQFDTVLFLLYFLLFDLLVCHLECLLVQSCYV